MKKGQEPAFPVYPRQEGSTFKEIKDAVGLTRRQWYAGKALPGLIAIMPHEKIPKNAFELADAMVEFEEKEKNGTKKDN